MAMHQRLSWFQLVPWIVLHQLINIVNPQLLLQLLHLTHSLISFLCVCVYVCEGLSQRMSMLVVGWVGERVIGSARWVGT